MYIELSQDEIDVIINNYISKKYNVKVIDIPLYEPYTLEVTDENN